MLRDFQRALVRLAVCVGGLAVMLLPVVLFSQSPKWIPEGEQRWTLRTDRTDVAYVLKDKTGFWGFDLMMNTPHAICFAATLQEAQQRVEKWEKR